MEIKFSEYGTPQPPGVRSVTFEEWKDFFQSIENQNRRKTLITGFERFIAELKNRVTPDQWKQWIGGSFTTTKVEPKDIDVVNFIDYGSIAEMNSDPGPYFTSKDPNIDSRVIYNIDSYQVPVYPLNDPRHKITNDMTKYWVKQFGYDRDKRPRAIFEVSL